jgi:hypothetical protein
MELLTAPATLRKAAVAAALTTLACLPRLFLWRDSPYPALFSAIVIAFTSGVMWGFVFAWEKPNLGRSPFSPCRSWRLWAAATAFALAGAAFRGLLLDPALVRDKLVTPPASFGEWAVGGLFQLAFLQLFLVFTPVAVCARIFRDSRVAILLGVGLGLYVGWRLLGRVETQPSLMLATQILLSRSVGDGVAIWFYQRGGLWLSWWMGLILHLRHLAWLTDSAGTGG